MSDPIQRELEILRQDSAPLEPRAPAPAAPLFEPAPVSAPAGNREQEALAWDSQNLDHWIDQVNRQRNFLEDRARADPTGLLEDQYLSALVLGQKLNIDPGFALEHLDQLAEQVYGEKVPVPSLGKAIRNAFRTGYITNRIALLDYQLATGASGAQAAGINAQIADWQGKLPPEDPLVRKFFGRALVWTAENVPLFVEGAIAGAAAALTVGGAAATSAYMSAAAAGAGAAATGVGVPVTLVTAGSAALSAFLTYGIPAFKAGSTFRMSQITIGQSYRALGEIRDKQGNPISPWLRSTLAMSFGTLQGFLENMQLETALATMGPGMQRLFGQGVQQVMRDTVLKSVGNRAIRAAARWGVDAATEGVEEGAQGLAQQMAENLARYIQEASSGAEFAYEDVQTVANRIREQMEIGFVVGGLLTLPGSLVSPFAEAYQERAESRQLDEQRQKRQTDQEQLLAKLQQELQKVVEAERTAAVSPAAMQFKPVAPLEPAQVLEYEQPPAEELPQAKPGTIGEEIRQDLAEAKAWAYSPEEWARIEQARAPSQQRVSTVSIYKDFFDPQMFPIRAMIAQAAPPGFDIEAIEMTGLLLDTLGRAQGQSTFDFVRDTFAPGIFASPEQIRNLPARVAEEARRRTEVGGATPEQQAEAMMQAQAKLAAAKGVTEWFDDGKALVYLFKTGDISTVVEEFAHVMRRRLPANLLEAAARWAGAVEGVWSEEAEEKFANGLLEYLRQGLAPNEEVRNIFQRLAEWLEYIYKAIRDRWQLSPEIVQVYDELLAARPLGQKLNTEPNPRPADTLALLFQVDPAVEPVDPDPAHVAEEEFLRASVYEQQIVDVYFDANGNRRTITVQGQVQEVSSRTMPVLGLRLKEGQWLVEDRFRGAYGHEIAQLRRLDPALLTLTEEDYTTGPNWEGRGDDARRYARWMSQGLTPPPITVVEGPAGELRVTDGHRRVAASKLAERPLYAWIWPAMDHPQGKEDAGTGLPIRVGLTFEAAKKRAWEAKPTFERFLFQVDPVKQQAFNQAVKEFFGTTDDPKRAAWILSTGEMLDFDGRWLKSEAVMVQGRAMHRLIGKVPTVGIVDAINGAERLGAIRLDFNPLLSILQTMEDPSEEQYQAIERICQAAQAVQLEKVDRRTGDMLAFKELSRPTVERVRDFFTAAALYSPKFLFQTDPWLLRSAEVVRLNIKAPIPGKQVKQILLANKVSLDELHWTGLDEFLEEGKKYGRNELLEYLAAHAIKVEEQIFGAPPPPFGPPELPAELANQLRTLGIEPATFPIITEGERRQYVEMYGIPNVVDIGYGPFSRATGSLFIDDETGRPVAYLPPRPEDLGRAGPGRGRPVTYPDLRWRTEVGENQRELVFSLPYRGRPSLEQTAMRVKPGKEAEVRKINEQLEILAQRRIEMLRRPYTPGESFESFLRARGSTYDEETRLLALREKYLELDMPKEAARWPDMWLAYRGSHYGGQPNIFGWIRSLDVQLSGKKTFLVDEFQSEWAEKARALGFSKLDEPQAIIRSYEKEAVQLRRKLIRDAEKLREASEKAERQQKALVEGSEPTKEDLRLFDSLHLGRIRLRQRVEASQHALEMLMQRAQKEIEQSQAVPPAPFIASRRWGIVFNGEEYKTAKGQKQRFTSPAEAEKYLKSSQLREKGEALGWKPESVQVVDLGYIENTTTWAGFEFKRALRWAVEHGYEKVAWTDGATQNKRWRLARFVTELAWEKQTDGNYRVTGYDENGDSIVEKIDIAPEQLAAYVGQDPTQKILAGQNDLTDIEQQLIARGLTTEIFHREGRWWIRYQNGKVMGTWLTREDAAHDARRQDENIIEWTTEPARRQYGLLRGLSLETGGEFMRLLYDRIQVDFASRYVKQWGGSVHEEKLPLGVRPLEYLPGQRYVLYDPQFMVQGTYETLEEAEAEAENQNGREGADAEADQGWHVVDSALVKDYRLDTEKNFENQDRFVWIETSTNEVITDPDSPDDPIFFLTKQEAWEWANHNLKAKPLSQTVHVVDITPAMRESVKEGTFQQFLMQEDPHETSTREAVEHGDPVPDAVLEVYKERPWAKEEIEARKRFVEEAKSMEFRDADEFIRFHDAFEGVGEPIRSYAYWRMIWDKAGGDVNVEGAEGFTPIPPAEANKRFLETVNTPAKMMIWLSNLDALTGKVESSKSKVWQGWWGFPKAIEIAYRQGEALSTETWAAALKAMKTEPERYREIDAALGDVDQQRQLEAERTMPPAEESRLREENARLRRELKLFRLVEKEQQAGILAGREMWQLTRSEWVARWPVDEKKPLGFLERHKEVVQIAIRQGKPVPPEVLLDYPDLQKEAAARTEVKRAKLEPELEIFAGFAAGEVPLSRVLMSVKELQRERKRLQASVKELEQKVETVSGIGGWLARERRRLDLVEKKITIQKVKERLQKRLEECYTRRQTDRANWKMQEQARYARIKRDSIIHWIRKVSWYQLPKMTAESAEKIREILEGIDLAFLGKRAAAKVVKLRLALSDPDYEAPQYLLDLLDSIEGRNIDELNDQELGGLYEAIQHWVTMNQEAQSYRIAGERIRAEKLVTDAIAEMRPAKEVAEELQRFFPLLWEKAREKGTTILDEFLGIGQKQWILIVENLAGRDSWIYKVLGQGIEEGRRKQFELKFKYWDTFEAGVQKLAIADLPAWLHEEQTFNNAGRALALRRGEKLALFMLGQDEDARASVLGAGLGSRRRAAYRNKPRAISEGLLEEVARSLDATEKGFVAVVRKVFDLTYEDLNEVYQQRYSHPLERIPNWMHKDSMPSGRASSLEEQRALEDFRKRNLRPGLPKGRVKTRKGVVIPLYLNSIEYDLMEAINYASTYAGLEIPVYQASKLLIDPDFRTELETRYGERTWRHLVRGLRDVYTEAEALSTVENAFAKTREMMTIAWLSLSPFSTLKIFLSFVNANAYVHLDYLVRGYADFTAHPIQIDQLNQALSPYYRDRIQRGFTRDLAEGLRKLESAGLIHARRTVSQYGMLPIQFTDRAVVSPVMHGAVLQALEEMQAGELSETTKLGIGNLVEGKDLKKLSPAERTDLAYRFADFVVQRTQDQRLPEYRSALSRSTSLAGFAKFLTMFGSNTNTNLNVLLRAVAEFKRAKNKNQAAGRLAHVCFVVLVVTPLSMAFVNVLRNYLLKRYGDDEDKDKKLWLGVLADYARELAGLSYFIRDLGDGAITLLQRHRVREFTVPPVQLLNDLFEVGRRGLAWASAEDRFDRNRLMWRFLDKASEWLLMVGEIPLVMPKRYLVEYLRKKAAGE